MEEGQIVKHKLTGERMLVLSSAGYGATYIPQTRLRRQRTYLEEIWLDTSELELAEDNKILLKTK
jgi:hypothetical protein